MYFNVDLVKSVMHYKDHVSIKKLLIKPYPTNNKVAYRDELVVFQKEE
jgi:hypothetical protein